jgi:hypothetical protein
LADATYVTTTRLPVDVLWAFVQDMDHWARFVTGYQSHEKKSDTESVWTLKGDLGVLSRTLTFRVLITEWNGPSRVRFALEGQNEPMRGEGAFTIEALAADGSEPAPAPGPRRAPAASGSGSSRPSGAGCCASSAVGCPAPPRPPVPPTPAPFA